MNDDFLINIDDFDETEQASAYSTDLVPSQSPSFAVSAFSPNKWDPRLLLDLVIAVDHLDDILERYGLSHEEYSILSSNVVFRRELASIMRDVRENGASFRAKARIQAESYLPVVDDMIWDREIAPSTRLDAVKSVVRWGDLEPKEKKEQTQQTQPQINVQILF